ncbi:MAG: nitric oxide-sensing protein NosP [Sandaracinaceae bacterium]
MEIRKGTSLSLDPDVAAAELYDKIHQADPAMIVFYCSPEHDLERLGKALATRFGEDAPMIGCTTAGEITDIGYLDGSITGVSIGSGELTAVFHRVDHLAEFELPEGENVARELKARMSARGVSPDPARCFGFLLIDGLSMREEPFVSAVYRALGSIQLFGGSAGDGTRFGTTYLYHRGEFRSDCAVLTLVHTERPFEVFKTQHFVSSEDKMVVTEADPSRRIVTEINGVPAGREYARMVGLEVDKLTPLIFATYPVVVRVGGSYYVRSIQKVNEDESLTFFCAIDEGIVLTVARGVDLVDNLKETFESVRARIGTPELVLGCDCILRSLELDQRGIKQEVAEIMRANNVVGFSTYGEQFNSMHVNQTFTGVAIG